LAFHQGVRKRGREEEAFDRQNIRTQRGNGVEGKPGTEFELKGQNVSGVTQ